MDLIDYCAMRNQGHEAVWDEMTDRVVWVWRSKVGDRAPLAYADILKLEGRL